MQETLNLDQNPPLHKTSVSGSTSDKDWTGKKNELPKTLVAMMEDRLLVQEGKEQIYGTQGSGFNTKNGWTMIIHPIKNPEKVNKLRKKVGFTETVEENAKRLGIDYKVLTLEDVKKLKENK